MNRRKHNNVNINLGISTILLIFFVLSMVSFAVLSLSSAVSDKHLTTKAVDKNLNYYNACNKMQFKLQEIDDIYYETYNQSSSETDFYSSLDEETVLTVPSGNNQQLEVIITPNFPKIKGDHFFTIKSWRLITLADPVIDFSINVIK